jgi:hypothetical protein
MKNLLFVLLLVPAMALAAETPDSATADPSAGGFGRKSGGALRHTRARVRAQRISKQDQSRAQQRCGRGAAAKTDAGILWLLRLALVGARTLVAGQTGPHISGRAVCERCTRRAQAKSDRGKFETGGDLVRGEGRSSFERPYGLSWLLQLCAELREWDDPQAHEWLLNLTPLEDAAVERLTKWLPKLSNPVRIGEHDQTAFGLGLMFDYARTTKNEAFARLVRDSSKKFFLADKNCPLNYEPSGEDFLSPCLGEADVMRRVLPQKEFAGWLKGFMPQIPVTENPDWLRVAISPDPSDPKLAHLDGLNLSRAWMLEGILSALPEDDPRRPALQAAADAHGHAGLAAVTGEHYEGGHWLGSFAVYLTTRRGIPTVKTSPSPSP